MDITYKIEHLPVEQYFNEMSEIKFANEIRRGDIIAQISGCITQTRAFSEAETFRPWGRVESIDFCAEPSWLALVLGYWGVNQRWSPTQTAEETFVQEDSLLHLMLQENAKVHVLSTGWTRRVPELFSLDMKPVVRPS